MIKKRAKQVADEEKLAKKEHKRKKREEIKALIIETEKDDQNKSIVELLRDFDLKKSLQKKGKIKPEKEQVFGVCDIPLPMKYIRHPKRNQLVEAVRNRDFAKITRIEEEAES